MRQDTGASELAKARSFNACILGARGLFSLMVFVCHIFISTLPTFGFLQGWLFTQASESLQYGVELFFCISGFVITASLIRHRSIAAFLLDRAIRIYPVLWATVPAFLVLELLQTRVDHTGEAASLLASLPTNLLALSNFVPLRLIHPAAWSLSFESVFYLAASFVALSIKSVSRHVGVALAMVAGALLVNYHPRSLFFLCGIIAFFPKAARMVPERLSAFPTVWLVVFLGSWRAVQLLTDGDMTTSSRLLDWTGDRRIVLTAIAFCAASIGFVGVVNGTGLLGKLLTTRIAAFGGRISYSFYLWHPLVLAVVKKTLYLTGLVAITGAWSQVVFFAITLPMSVCIAVISRELLEVQAGKWLHLQLAGRRSRVRQQTLDIASR